MKKLTDIFMNAAQGVIDTVNGFQKPRMKLDRENISKMANIVITPLMAFGAASMLVTSGISLSVLVMGGLATLILSGTHAEGKRLRVHHYRPAYIPNIK